MFYLNSRTNYKASIVSWRKNKMAGIDNLKGYAMAVVGLAIIDVMGLAVISGFKDTGLVDNTTADKFITGLGIFGTFIVVVVLALVGKIIMGLFRTD